MLIKAGGVGKRMNAGIPKQFVEIHGKPVIVYTMEQFQAHPEIDQIVAVCVAGWEDRLWKYANDFGISKLKKVVPGGDTSLKSIKNGVISLLETYNDEDIILVHDGNRPLISHHIISDVIAHCRQNGSAVAAIPCTDEIMVASEQFYGSEKFMDHKMIYRIQTPDAYRLRILKKIFAYATEEQLQTIGATNTLMIDMGEKVYFAKGSELNIRLTTQEDILQCEALLMMEKRLE